MKQIDEKIIHANFVINFTNWCGAVGLFLSIAGGFDVGCIVSAVLILGRSGIELAKLWSPR